MNRRIVTSLLLAISAFCYVLVIQASAQSSARGAFQSDQIGPNSFVSTPGGEVYLIFYNQLYHSIRDEADSWDQLASGMKAVAIDPQNPKVLYGIDTQNHIVKSLDAGQNWITLNTGLPNIALLALSVNPANSQEVFVGTASGLFKTTDAGFSWHPTSFMLAVNQIFANPHSSSSQYLLSAGTIFASSDGGSTWKKSESGLPVELVRGAGRTASKVPAHVSLLIFVDWQKPFLLAATYNKGVFRSDDGGISWVPAGTGLELSEPFVTAAIGKRRIVLAAPDFLYGSIDGMNWTKIAIKSGRNTPKSYLGVIEYPKREGILLHFRFAQDTGDTMRIGYLDTKGVLVGLNYGVVPHSEIDSVSVGQTNGRPAIFATTANLYDSDQVERNTRPTFTSVSTDYGYSWDIIGKPVCGESAASPRGADGEIWVYGSPTCITRTQDGGLTWNHLPGVEFRFGNASMSNLEFDPKDHNVAYYCVGVNEYYLYRYQFNSATKQGQAVDLKVVASDVLVDETNPSALFTDSTHLSPDGGWTWTDKSASLANLFGGVPALSNRTFKLVSFRSGEIRAVVGQFDRMSSNGSITVIRSPDSGTTWQQVATVESRAPQFQWQWPKVFRNRIDSSNFFVVTFASSQTRGSNAIKLLETKDGGRNWREVYSRTTTQDDNQREAEIIHSVAQIREGANRDLLIGGRYGLWKSADEGATWKRLGGAQ